MEAAKNRRRLIVLTIILCVCFAGLGYRLIDLQWARHEEFRIAAERQHQHEYYREPQRGDIRDRRGQLLATSVPVKRVCADPALLKGHEAEMAKFLAPLLKTNEMVLLNAFRRQIRTNSEAVALPNHFVLLKNKVSIEDWDKTFTALTNQFTSAVGGAKLDKKDYRDLQLLWTRSIYTEDDQIRSYPNAQIAAHVLGFTGQAPFLWAGETNWMTAGMEGIEYSFDEKLRGSRGWVKTERDIRRRELFLFREQDVESRPGLNVALTIDARVQQIVEEELAEAMTKNSPISVSSIVVRPRTGEILGLATLPTFNPNEYWHAPADARRNRVIADTAEPGSTFKIVVVSGALDGGVTKLTDSYDCENGAFHFAGQVLHDHLHFGVLSVESIIRQSSNIGAAKIGIKMGEQRLYDYILGFGFNHRTGIPLRGEVGGVVHPLKDWSKLSISRIPMGHEMTATPLQMVMAMSAVANRGRLMRPMLVDRLEDEKGAIVTRYEPQMVRQVIRDKAAEDLVTALKTVVTKTGTAPKAALEHYTVAGKTGTAQKPPYTNNRYFSSFIGFFPADNPELCISVVMDEPKGGYYGGQIAAPVFKRIAERVANFLNVKPDIQPEQPGELIGVSPDRAMAQANNRP
jgi:cell division protein FtsI/penicillin-binding protein 2